MKRPTARRIAGWALLSLIPITFIALAIAAGQLAALAIGTVGAALIGLVIWAGLELAYGDRSRP